MVADEHVACAARDCDGRVNGSSFSEGRLPLRRRSGATCRTGQIQIRKVVNGVITVLASANFTATLGQYCDVRFLVISDQLQVYVDGSLTATAHDGAIASGKYGLATYRAKANWETLSVLQP
jgi:hypothetical protein